MDTCSACDVHVLELLAEASQSQVASLNGDHLQIGHICSEFHVNSFSIYSIHSNEKPHLLWCFLLSFWPHGWPEHGQKDMKANTQPWSVLGALSGLRDVVLFKKDFRKRIKKSKRKEGMECRNALSDE